eukprot:5976638-Prymnesium_polylepis.1
MFLGRVPPGPCSSICGQESPGGSMFPLPKQDRYARCLSSICARWLKHLRPVAQASAPSGGGA